MKQSQQIILKHTLKPGAAPDADSLEYGELVINCADGKIFYKDIWNRVVTLSDTIFNDSRFYERPEPQCKQIAGSAVFKAGQSYKDVHHDMILSSSIACVTLASRDAECSGASVSVFDGKIRIYAQQKPAAACKFNYIILL